MKRGTVKTLAELIRTEAILGRRPCRWWYDSDTATIHWELLPGPLPNSSETT